MFRKRMITIAMTCFMTIGCVIPVWAGVAGPGSPGSGSHGIPIDVDDGSDDVVISAEAARKAIEEARNSRMQGCLHEAGSVPDEIDADAARDALEEARDSRMQGKLQEQDNSSNTISSQNDSLQIAEEAIHSPWDDDEKTMRTSSGDGKLTGKKPKGK
ncbi:MAG: hypothetical protein ABRQ26_12325 [Syntrophomonadaceae bacterium]